MKNIHHPFLSISTSVAMVIHMITFGYGQDWIENNAVYNTSGVPSLTFFGSQILPIWIMVVMLTSF